MNRVLIDETMFVFIILLIIKRTETDVYGLIRMLHIAMCKKNWLNRNTRGRLTITKSKEKRSVVVHRKQNGKDP